MKNQAFEMAISQSILDKHGAEQNPFRRADAYTVQQAAELTGLSEHTMRYYERIGLIEPIVRDKSSGHRRYGREDLVKLEAIACLRATRMPIDQMRRYFELRADGGQSADAVELQALLTSHLTVLHEQIKDLMAYAEYVSVKIQYWKAIEEHEEEAAARLAEQSRELIRAAQG